MCPLARKAALLPLAVLAAGLCLAGRSGAAEQKPFPGARKGTAPAAPAPRSAVLTSEAWQRASLAPLRPGEIDELVLKELHGDRIEPAPLITDEQFLRRVYLDLTGELPVPADVREFVANSDPQKRARVIDKLLDSDEYAAHWARYWRDVLATHLTDPRARLLVPAFERWMTEQLKKNTSWGEIARAMIAADGELRYGEEDKNGAAFFLAARRGADAANERAAETSRVFLGIQIQCAQCHDHPFDQWKRVQFHELAAYFARLAERPLRDGQRLVGVELLSRPFGEQRMPDKDDPRKALVTQPRFLTGQSPGQNLNDRERRRALAAAVTDPANYWFAAAYVNRAWGELMGQSFYQPVDDMGPQKEAVFPAVLTRLTGSFRGGNYDVKALFRAVLNSQTYQRQVRLGEWSDQHLHFAAAYPTRLRADALWQSLTNVLGSLGGPRDMPPRPGFGPGFLRQTFEVLFKEEFTFDPSLKPDEVEGSIPQALLMMNSPILNSRIQARGNNVLARILSSHPQDDDAIRMVYLKTLARKPTDREMQKSRDYIRKVGSRTEAFEDLLWALLNSTEFQTKR